MNSKIINYLLLIFSLSFFIASILGSYFSGGIGGRNYASDFRNRIVGARTAYTYKDPYFHFWQQGDSTRYLDPVQNPKHEVTRTTSTPTLLAILVPISFLHYLLIRDLLFMFNLVAFLGTIHLIQKIIKEESKQKLVLYLSLFLSFTPTILTTLILGQIYLIYLCIFLLSFWLIEERNNKVGIILIGLLIVTRPQYFPAVFAFLFKKDSIKNLITFLGTCAVSIFATTVLFGFEIWIKYFQAVRIQSSLIFNSFYENFNPSQYYPEFIEGSKMSPGIGNISFYDTSLKGAFLRLFDYDLSNIQLMALSTILIASLFYLLIKYYKKSANYLKINYILLFVMTMDIITPATRYAYYDVLLFPIFIFIFFKYKNLKTIHKIIFCFYFLTGMFIHFFDTPAKIAFIFTVVPIALIATIRESQYSAKIAK